MALELRMSACPTCRGKRQITVSKPMPTSRDGVRGIIRHTEDCEACGGTGMIVEGRATGRGDGDGS